MGWSTARHNYMSEETFKQGKSTSFPDQFPVFGRIISQIWKFDYLIKTDAKKYSFFPQEGKRQIPLMSSFSESAQVPIS